jgi:hypothetical protein
MKNRRLMLVSEGRRQSLVSLAAKERRGLYLKRNNGKRK